MAHSRAPAGPGAMIVDDAHLRGLCELAGPLASLDRAQLAELAAEQTGRPGRGRAQGSGRGLPR
ncbi:hypothetical protein BC739_004345 [Kutzneria viridogrisea]|nr:hypothetical protein [Kutzneria albida]MBA8927139.1 hypothetical protein [Kutzneria viridogrisea]